MSIFLALTSLIMHPNQNMNELFDIVPMFFSLDGRNHQLCNLIQLVCLLPKLKDAVGYLFMKYKMQEINHFVHTFSCYDFHKCLILILI